MTSRGKQAKLAKAMFSACLGEASLGKCAAMQNLGFQANGAKARQVWASGRRWEILDLRLLDFRLLGAGPGMSGQVGDGKSCIASHWHLSYASLGKGAAMGNPGSQTTGSWAEKV